MKEALYYEQTDQDKVKCRLCPHNCTISPNRLGICRARKNIEDKLYSLIYGKTTGIALDPIEKKPLYHFYPGSLILSLGTKGCNFACPFCQNWRISQDDNAYTEEITPLAVARQATVGSSIGVAYTYNEPFIWYEFVLECAKLIKKQNQVNVLVTNGYVNLEPLEEILPYIDAMNIDLKSIDEDFYRKICKAKLQPVLDVIKRSIKDSHIELTNLVIPTLNDTEDNFIRLVDWVYENCGPEIPLHFSRYFPAYKMDLPPTPIETLKIAYNIAKKRLKYVYLGNV